MQEASLEQKDIIAILMLSEELNDDELTDQLLTLLAAGKHIDVQERLRQKCQDICGGINNAGETTPDRIHATHHLDVVCNEFLPLYSVAPIISGICNPPTPVGAMTFFTGG
ncbi:hypothetical protein LTR56_022988 [Elasticomyces elasticus]|nr:hypothetical protein LTR56_022988 [Elasticomyces elasticus]KAK4907392.1 hypothetical protein LTR49_023575 [Elasticomyces elasticus]